jgi:hypothetical protein
MMGWLNRSVHCSGSAVFRGKLPPRLEELRGLSKFGVRVRLKKQDPRVHWAAELEHERWGKALMLCLRNMPEPPRQWIEHDAGLSEVERAEALAGQSHVTVRVDGAKGNVLRDRKHLLGFLRAAMGDDGAVAADHTAMRLWSRAALDDELAHDADLDIEGLYCVHAVVPEGGEAPTWLHTHGLAQIGFFDFDILSPNTDLLGAQADALRAIALAIVEGDVKASMPSFDLAEPGGRLRFVEVSEFNRRADAPSRALRLVDDTDEDHNKDRTVICEPAGGMLGRFFDKLKPCRFLSGEFPDDAVMRFSTAAGGLMAERARATYGQFCALVKEFEEFEFTAIVKFGYVVDGGGADDKEHLWFSVDSMHSDHVNATLRSQPFRISRMTEGQQGSHRLELMSDWAIMTPAGLITPRNTTPARLIREQKAELRQALAEHRAGG